MEDQLLLPHMSWAQTNLDAIETDLLSRDHILDLLKKNGQTQFRIKKQADLHRTDIQFQEGDLVYVKL